MTPDKEYPEVISWRVTKATTPGIVWARYADSVELFTHTLQEKTR